MTNHLTEALLAAHRRAEPAPAEPKAPRPAPTTPRPLLALRILDWEFAARSAEEAHAALMRLRTAQSPAERERPRGFVHVNGRAVRFRRLYLTQ